MTCAEHENSDRRPSHNRCHTMDIPCFIILTFSHRVEHKAWWQHQMETFSALPAFCEGNSPVSGGVFLNKQLSKQSRHWLFETPLHPLWHHCNDPRRLVCRRACVNIRYKGIFMDVFCMGNHKLIKSIWSYDGHNLQDSKTWVLWRFAIIQFWQIRTICIL